MVEPEDIKNDSPLDFCRYSSSASATATAAVGTAQAISFAQTASVAASQTSAVAISSARVSSQALHRTGKSPNLERHEVDIAVECSINLFITGSEYPSCRQEFCCLILQPSCITWVTSLCSQSLCVTGWSSLSRINSFCRGSGSSQRCYSKPLHFIGSNLIVI